MFSFRLLMRSMQGNDGRTSRSILLFFCMCDFVTNSTGWDSFSVSSFFSVVWTIVCVSHIPMMLAYRSEIIKGEKYFTNNNRSQVADEWHLQIQFHSFCYCYLLEWHFFSCARFYWIYRKWFFTWLRRRKAILGFFTKII